MVAFSAASGSPATACTRQGWRLPPDGARAAASSRFADDAPSTGSGLKARTDMRRLTASITSIEGSLNPNAYPRDSGVVGG
jgi:hypothetical protein